MSLFNVLLLTQLIQPSILFNDDLATSTNKGGLVDDGVEREVSNSSSSLTSPSSRAVIVRDEDGVSIHSMADEDESAYVSKLEVSKDVLPEPKNLSLKLKAEDDGEVDPSVQDTTIVDVSPLVHVSLSFLGNYFTHPFASCLILYFRCRVMLVPRL